MDPAPRPLDRDTLARVLAAEGDRLYALALRVTRDPDLAADALQDAFAAALEGVDAFRGEASPATWLYRIVYTKSIDLLRRRGREVPLPETEARPRADAGAAGSVPSWSRPPDEILLGAEAWAAFERALGELTPVQRAVIELKEIEGRPSDEVARILGIPPGTVRVHLHRARLRLRTHLGGLLRGAGR